VTLSSQVSLSHCEYLTDSTRTLQHIFRPLRPAIIQSLLQIVHVEKSEATWCDGGGIVTLENVPIVSRTCDLLGIFRLEEVGCGHIRDTVVEDIVIGLIFRAFKHIVRKGRCLLWLLSPLYIRQDGLSKVTQELGAVPCSGFAPHAWAV